MTCGYTSFMHFFFFFCDNKNFSVDAMSILGALREESSKNLLPLMSDLYV
jgi:hypothetical protein